MEIHNIRDCDDLNFENDIDVMNAVKNLRAHVGPGNMGRNHDTGNWFARVLFAEEGDSSEPFVLVFNEICLRKLHKVTTMLIDDVDYQNKTGEWNK